VIIRLASKNDYESIWHIFSQVVKDGKTYVFSPDTTKEEFETYWLSAPITTFVAEEEGKIVGTYVIKPNHVGLGDHIANCSYMVSESAQGKGIGKMMCAHSIDYATEMGYKAIQFNIVISTNVAAIALWKKFGFQIIGTIPKAFRHSQLGLVDAYIMFRQLDFQS
tara:strand:+ start:5477 stop:5971 length:495 start_codon:yes stop_codon:yes gene_type:complete